jgi:hypothetical protein
MLVAARTMSDWLGELRASPDLPRVTWFAGAPQATPTARLPPVRHPDFAALELVGRGPSLRRSPPWDLPSDESRVNDSWLWARRDREGALLLGLQEYASPELLLPAGRTAAELNAALDAWFRQWPEVARFSGEPYPEQTAQADFFLGLGDLDQMEELEGSLVTNIYFHSAADVGTIEVDGVSPDELPVVVSTFRTRYSRSVVRLEAWNVFESQALLFMRVVYEPRPPSPVVARWRADAERRALPVDYPVDALEAGLGLDHANLDAMLARGEGADLLPWARVILDAKEVRQHRNSVLVAPAGIAAMHARVEALRAHPAPAVRAEAEQLLGWLKGRFPSRSPP